MNALLTSALGRFRGVASRRQLIEAGVPEDVLDRAAAADQVIRLLPRIYALPGSARTPSALSRAALLFCGPGSALSHTTALQRWPSLPDIPDDRVHVTTPRDRDRRSIRFVVVHRHPRRQLPPDFVVTRGGLPTVRLDVTLIDCWESGDSRYRRQPIIDAVRTRQVTATSLRDIALRSPRLRGRAELLRLLDLLDGGCQSELEIAGHLKVFSHRSLPTSRRQWPVIVYGRCYLLDVAWPELMLAVELDGAAYHGSRKQRERDVRRDAGLAASGWQVIRVTHARLTADPAGVRAELAVIISARRAQLSAVGRA